MSSETITTAIFLIAAVIAAAVLANAIFPLIYTVSDTAGSTAHAADQRIRTDIKIINTFASGGSADIWIKNIGSTRISANEIAGSDIFIGAPGNFDRISYPADWSYTILDDGPDYWLTGNTVHIKITSDLIPTTRGDLVYFKIVLPGGTVRSTEFTVGG
ncbi:MAG: archaeal flagellar protein FlaG [Methanofollis sp.]|nr:archaeal flagellar protein FlaG [Methanofollis sp.]